MMEEVIFAGFGGQGMLLAGQFIAYAGLNEGKNVSWLPSYGPEMRGGTANCSVIVSSEEIGSPVIVEPDALIVMNRPSLEKFEKTVKKGGTLIINSSLIDVKATRDDIHVIYVPANGIAEEIGNTKVANMVILGAYIEKSGVVNVKSVLGVIEKKMGAKKAHLVPINEEALKRGAACVE